MTELTESPQCASPTRELSELETAALDVISAHRRCYGERGTHKDPISVVIDVLERISLESILHP